MSSIIKSGSAPSNTPDGKYFLQTDQACYAELKRGRTYIMTAQEVSKVSHYVIITNADFTVTFNGDSDLVQCGISNNAIVMMVHRACRIDFTQGGNLEFKEGTAEFSSRITMGPNASGNVLVAASLPQQGDFAGQICSLTTGATYVWTGSEWSSTAGSSTLPTPTSSNKYWGLVSTGSAWEANRGVYGRKAQLSNIAANAVVYYPLFKMSGAEGVAHGAISGQFGIHNNASFQIFVDVTLWGGTTSMGVLTVLKSYARLNSTVSYNSLSLKIGSDKTVYLRMQGVSPSTEGAVYTINKFIGDADTVEPSSPTPFVVTDESQYSNLTSYEKHTPVPVSTAANQMLVSDGNGGWKVLAAGAVGTTLKMTSDGPAWST